MKTNIKRSSEKLYLSFMNTKVAVGTGPTQVRTVWDLEQRNSFVISSYSSRPVGCNYRQPIFYYNNSAHVVEYLTSYRLIHQYRQ